MPLFLLLLLLTAPLTASAEGPTHVLPPAAAAPLSSVQTAFSDAGTGWALDRVNVQQDTVELRFEGEGGPIDAVLSRPARPRPGAWYALSCEHPLCPQVAPALSALLTERVTDDPWLDLSKRRARDASRSPRAESPAAGPTPPPKLADPPTNRTARRLGLAAVLLLGVLSTLFFSSDRTPPGADPSA